MKSQKDVLQIIKKTSHLLEIGSLKSEPVWFKAVLATPPISEETGKSNALAFKSPIGSKLSKRVPSIKYPEDSIREMFYRHHPWELARPKILVEDDGLNFTRHDWSKMGQNYKKLDGESVVQRTLWLMKHENLSKFQAYDQARREFYRLRQREEVEQLTTEEESRMFGAVFFPSHVEYGVELEQDELEKWRNEAIQQSRIEKSKATMAGDENDS
ncbi:mitochondrial ribosomal protein S25-domain-containing protein [Dipodascopsis uninucleata]